MVETNEKSKTVLVVDDEVHIVNVVALKFRNDGYRVLTARDPQSAFEIAQQEAPNLVITDHQMSGGMGVDLCKWLKSTAATADIPVILLTAYDFSIAEDSLGECNIHSIMAKPFSPQELLNRAAAIIGAVAQQQ